MNTQHVQFKEIVTPRNKNIGSNIKNTLINQGIYNLIDILSINTTRDTTNKCNISEIRYIPK